MIVYTMYFGNVGYIGRSVCCTILMNTLFYWINTNIALMSIFYGYKLMFSEDKIEYLTIS